MPKVKPLKKLIRFGSRFGWCGTCVKAAKKNEPGFCNHNEAVSTDNTLIQKGVIIPTFSKIKLKGHHVSL